MCSFERTHSYTSIERDLCSPITQKCCSDGSFLSSFRSLLGNDIKHDLSDTHIVVYILRTVWICVMLGKPSSLSKSLGWTVSPIEHGNTQHTREVISHSCLSLFDGHVFP